MEYSIKDLPNAIYYFLSLYPNKRFNLKDLRQNLTDEKICTDYLLSTSCADGEIFWNTICQKVCKTYQDVDFNNGEISLSVKNEKKYNMNEIEKIVKYPDDYPNILFDKPYKNTGDTILHILCKEGKFDLLDELCEKFDLDLDAVNGSGQYINEVIPKTPKGVKTMGTLFKLMHENHNLKICNIKKLNSKLQIKNNQLTSELESSNKKYQNVLNSYLNLQQATSALLLILLMVFVIYLYRYLY